MDDVETKSLTDVKEYQIKSVEDDKVIIDDDRSWTPFFRQLMISTGAWAVPFVTGLSIGSTSIIVNQIRNEAGSEDAVSVEMSSWLTICAPVSSIIWAIIFSILMKHVGRKKPYLLACTTMLIGYIIMYFSSTPLHLLISEFFKGSGFASNLTITIYIVTEYTSPKYRGVFLAIKGSSVVWGVMVMTIIGKYLHWKYISVTALVCFTFNITLLFWPESPFWLASQGKYRLCMESHRWLKGKGAEAEKELKSLLETQKMKRRETEKLSNQKKVSMKTKLTNLFKIMLKPQFYKPMLIGNLILLIDSASGNLMIVMYGVEIMKKITNDLPSAYNLLIIGSVVTVFGMYLGSGLVKFLSRRSIFIGASTSIVVHLFMLSLYYYLVKSNYLKENFAIAVVLVSGFHLSFAMGPLILCFALYAELIPLESRTAFSILGFSSLTLVSSTYLKIVPYIFNALSLELLFLCHALSALVVTILLWRYLPETKDKTLIEIQMSFQSKRANLY